MERRVITEARIFSPEKKKLNESSICGKPSLRIFHCYRRRLFECRAFALVRRQLAQGAQ